jgi:hypothetical protein
MLIYAIVLLWHSKQGRRASACSSNLVLDNASIIIEYNIIYYIYGCHSDSQRHTDKKIHFFEFPKDSKGTAEEKRRNLWIDFCKRKKFAPTRTTRICSLHSSSDAFEPSSSPEFLQSLNFTCTRRLNLKDDAVPTENKPLLDAKNEGQVAGKQAIGSWSRRRVGHETLSCEFFE